jgi:L-threonylcarbamoyladenylate synthase
VWGIGCDATNEIAVKRVFELKKRVDTKAMIVLVENESAILNYVSMNELQIFDYILIPNSIIIFPPHTITSFNII